MPVVEVPVSKITDWDTVHDVFATTLGFPDFYGRNMNAWIDCLTYADENNGMRSITVAPGDVLTLQFDDAKAFRARCPDIYAALMECAAFVNWRRIQASHRPIIAVSFS